jgi:parvulin-like peptidyl-prolyl isomerase
MSLNTMRESFKRTGPWLMGIVTAAMVITTVSGGFNSHSSLTQSAASDDDVVATVNGLDIKRSEYDKQFDNLRQQQVMMGQPASIMQDGIMGVQSFEQLAQAKIEMQTAEKQGLTVSDDEVTKELEDRATQLDVRTKLGLSKTATLSEIDAAFAKNGGPTFTQRMDKDAVRQSILLKKLQDKVKKQAPVTEQDVRNSYRQYHTRHILIDNKKRSDEQAQKQAQEILAKAKAPGADFGALAKQYSDDPGTKNKGGDDGWVDQKTGYVEEFTKAAFSLQPNQVTPDLVKSPQFGYFIIKLEAVRDNVPKDFDKTKTKLIADYTQSQQDKAWQDYEKTLREDPTVKYTFNDPALEGGHNLARLSSAKDQAGRDAMMKEAMADYKKALAKDPKGARAAGINVLLGQIASQMKQNKDAIAYYTAAVATSDDAQLHMALGQAYMEDKNNDKAVEQFQAASKQAWDDQQVHQMLMGSYLQMKRMDLVAQEQKWMTDYQKNHPQPSMNLGGPGAPSGTPITVQSPSGGPAGKIHVGAPAAPAPKPAQ